jgi:hypothetical protein
MPADNGSGRNQNERSFPSRPEPSQDNPEQLVQRSQSTARSFDVQRQNLLTESEIFKDEILSGTESTDNPSQEMSERHDYGQNHGQNLIETRPIKLVSNSVILQVYEVLTRDSICDWQMKLPNAVGKRPS